MQNVRSILYFLDTFSLYIHLERGKTQQKIQNGELFSLVTVDRSNGKNTFFFNGLLVPKTSNRKVVTDILSN